MRKRFVAVVLLVALLAVWLPAPPRVEAAILPTPTPISLQNIQYSYQPRVKQLNLATATRLGDTLLWPGAELTPGDILVDNTLQTSLKVLHHLGSGQYLVSTPTLYELFRELTIPRQVLIPNEANVTEFGVKGIALDAFLAQQAAQAPGNTQTTFSASGPALMQEIKAIFAHRGTKIYTYDGVYHFKPFGTSTDTVKLALRGAVGVSPGIVAEYSLFDGYEFGFVDAAQFIELNMMFDLQIDEELYLPIFAVTVPIPGLGGIKLGVYLVVDVNGDITLTVKASEGILSTASVHGGTSFGVPTSFHIDTDYDHYFDAECDPMGQIEAGLYITPLIHLEILDVDVFGAQLRLGFFTYAHVDQTTMNYGVDFVLHAFVVILDDRTDLFKLHLPILQRYKSFNPADDVIFYFSRLCVYQDRINLAAFTKRMAGASSTNATPFSDKEPFAWRNIEIHLYRNGTDAKGGTATPNQTIVVQTDGQGAASVDLSAVDIQKGDRVMVKAPGFTGQTDLIPAVTPFGAEKLPGQSDFYGDSKVWADFFEEKVTFNGLSGPDLTVLDVPNTELTFQTQKWIRYQGPVKLFSTSTITQETETAWIVANGVDKEYHPWANGSFNGVNTTVNQPYNIKPNHEIRWQVNVDGYIYGTYEPTGAGGHLTSHWVSVHRVIEDEPIMLYDLEGHFIGIRHQVALHVVAVNRAGNRTYTGSADLQVSLGKVPADYVQTFEKDKTIMDLGYVKFPAANVRYPLHYEYYTSPEFAEPLFEMSGEPTLLVSAANNQTLSQVPLPQGAVSMAHYLWIWEERVADVPATREYEEWQTVISPTTGRPMQQWVTVTEPNWKLVPTGFTTYSEFSGLPVAYVHEVAHADELQNGDVYQSRHVVSGMALEGVALPDPSVAPPAPVIYDTDELLLGDARKFDIEFQLQQMRDVDRFVVNPLDLARESASYRSKPSVMLSLKSHPVSIANAALIPAWAKEYVSAVVQNGLMRLDGAGRFAVGEATTRAEFAGAVVRALGLSEDDAVRAGFPFGDVAANDADRAAMELAYRCGVINGMSTTAFAPGATVTRQDAATMLLRAFALRNAALVPASGASLAGFRDGAAVSGYASTGMSQAVALGFFSGYTDGSLKPQNQILSEQTAKIVWEMKLKALK